MSCRGFVVLVSLALSPVAAGAVDYGLPLRGEAAETFLREAQVVARSPIGVGLTRPDKLTLTDGTRTLHAVWKTVDELRHETARGRKGSFQITVRDSYRYEIAAYELDALLGLGLVPPTVEREIDGRRGSLQLWVEGARTEHERQEAGIVPPDPIAWSNVLHDLRVFQQLVYDSDYLNVRNILYDPGFRLYSVDHSRAFRTFPELPEEARLVRFSRSTLARLEALTRDRLEAALGRWLTELEIEGVLLRRDAILARAEALAARLGAYRVLYP